MHTPGHTPEAVVYLVIDTCNNDKPIKVSIMGLSYIITDNHNQ